MWMRKKKEQIVNRPNIVKPLLVKFKEILPDKFLNLISRFSVPSFSLYCLKRYSTSN